MNETVPQTLLDGRATAEGTRRFAARHASHFASGFYRPLGRAKGTLQVSSIGFGTYLGECDGAHDTRYARSARRALERGVNLLDTAINYRCQRSERVVGRVLAHAVSAGIVARDEVVVCTKGGYIPLDDTPPESRGAYQAYLKREYFDRRIMTPDDIVAGGHCLAPTYLADQIARSRANLGLATLDVYYLHNPEQQLEAVTPREFRLRLCDALALLEERCAAGELGVYGCATWGGFRAAPDARGHLSLAELVAVAREVGGQAHHFRVVQLPISLGMPEAVRSATQAIGGRCVSLLQAAADLGVAVVASAPLLQAKLTAGLPEALREALPGYATDAQRAIAFVRSLPVVTATLVGMKTVEHLEENLEAGAQRDT